ncbi:MAG: glycosyltransferase family 4 protein [Anaerolineaceae bacterium]
MVEKNRRESQPLIINPRGMRAYVRNDTFFHAIPQILAQMPEVRFICPGMAGESQILDWVEKLDISRAVTLLPRLNRADMATLFNQAVVSVSLTEHDGTPNTLLEAMACGCFPVAGDIETLREWITPGINGLLVPPDDSQAVANAVLSALALPELRQRARDINISIIKERADYTKIMPKALSFYRSLISST